LVVAAMVGLGVSVAVGLLRWWWSSRDGQDDDVDLDRMRLWLMMRPPAPVAVPSMQSTPTVQLAQQQGQLDALRHRLDAIEQRLSSSAGSSFADRTERLRRLLEDGGRD